MSAGTTGPQRSAVSIGLVTDASGDDLASPAYVATVVAAVTTLAGEIVERWFATPVKPMLMQAGRAAQR